ncbi:hypothetical protein HY932_01535 [Candidatus Falkowbacteria bacterium]|nr:hypothetical protein [Candidatus Falkowbacteria bacterium]
MKEGTEKKKPERPVVNPPAAGGGVGPQLRLSMLPMPDLRLEQRLHMTPRVRKRVDSREVAARTMLPRKKM